VSAGRRRAGHARPARTAWGLGAGVLAIAALPLAGCYAPQIGLLRSGLDSLRTVVDTMQVRDAAAYQLLAETRAEMASQRDILLSTRASSGTTTQELFDQMGRLEGKLDEAMGRFTQASNRAATTATAGADAQQLYDQGSQDLTQGRYSLALQNFREFVRRFPTAELADNAQYGIGECFFAQSQFDSAAVEYGRVEVQSPQGDRVPAALYKLGLCQERLGDKAASKQTLESLVKRFPLAGEAQLARERLGTPPRR
jgi:tol-pal system protein YbgF